MQENNVTAKQNFGGALYALFMHPGGRPAKHPRSDFGKRLAQVREQAGISQIELAQKIGVFQQTIALWERRANAVRSDTLTKLAQALGTSVDELLGVTPPKPKRLVARGRLQRVFEEASQLPRRQQQKIAEVVQALVAQHGNGHEQAA